MPKKVTSNQDKYFTLPRFTTLSGEPTIYCIIFSSTKQNAIVESGADFVKSHLDSAEDLDFFSITLAMVRCFLVAYLASLEVKLCLILLDRVRREVFCLICWFRFLKNLMLGIYFLE